MDAATHAAEHASPDAHGADEVRKHVRVYIMVFIALACLTAVTVGVSYIHFGHHWVNVAIGLAIATAKGALVAGYFMHLISERKVIFWVLALTAFFFALALFLPLLTAGEVAAAQAM